MNEIYELILRLNMWSVALVHLLMLTFMSPHFTEPVGQLGYIFTTLQVVVSLLAYFILVSPNFLELTILLIYLVCSGYWVVKKFP